MTMMSIPERLLGGHAARVMAARAEEPPMVLCVHASASGGGQWRSLRAALAGRFRVESPDLYGYGNSPDHRASGISRDAQTRGAIFVRLTSVSPSRSTIPYHSNVFFQGLP